MIQWCEKKGNSLISFFFFFCLPTVALQDLPADEELFVIPREILLLFENSALSHVPGIKDKARELGPWLTLILTMVYEYLQQDSSRWHQYFRVLPTALDTLMFWSAEELAELQGSPVVARIGKTEADQAILTQLLPIVVAHADLFHVPPGIGSFDSPDGRALLLRVAHHMGSLIMAYAFDVEKAEDDDENENEAGQDGYLTDDEEVSVEKAMVPLADMLNADADRNNVRSHQPLPPPLKFFPANLSRVPRPVFLKKTTASLCAPLNPWPPAKSSSTITVTCHGQTYCDAMAMLPRTTPSTTSSTCLWRP